jgi:hypothetical protein
MSDREIHMLLTGTVIVAGLLLWGAIYLIDTYALA